MSAKWPRWFVPNCISKPSAVRRSGMRHDAGVVHQHVEAVDRRSTCSAARLTEVEVGEVERHDLRRRAGGTAFTASSAVAAFVALRHAEQDPRARRRQRLGRAQAEPAVGPGDEHGAAGLIGHVLEVPAASCGQPFSSGGRALGS